MYLTDIIGPFVLLYFNLPPSLISLLDEDLSRLNILLFRVFISSHETSNHIFFCFEASFIIEIANREKYQKEN